jgi:hypothetical protein
MIVMPITIDGVDITNIMLTTAPGWSMLGQIVTEEGIAPRRGQYIRRLRDAESARRRSDSQANRDPDNGRVLATGPWVTGSMAAVCMPAPDGWWVKSIVQDGRDLADTPAAIRSGETLAGVRIVVSEHPTSVRGRLVDDKGTPVTGATVVAFARDSQKWFEESRWVRAVRPDRQGNYRIDGLPPGEYLAVAIDYVEDGTWNDAAFIESLRDRGEPLTLTEGEARTVTLKLVTP